MSLSAKDTELCPNHIDGKSVGGYTELVYKLDESLRLISINIIVMETQEILDNHYEVHKNTSLLDCLLEFEKSADEMGIYTYKNWMEGEIVAGPKVGRYWVEVTIMYPREQMPDPQADNV